VKYLMQSPLPDELLSSGWIRSCRATNLPIYRLTQAALQRKYAPGFFQVGHLTELSEIYGWPIARLIQDHTVLPYSLAFYRPKAHAAAIKAAGCSGTSARGLGAVTQTVSDAVPWRRFCPECARADEIAHGKSYWHRSHNLPGVLICLVHRCILMTTTLPGRGRSSWREVLPREVEEGSPAAPRMTKVLENIARASCALLAHDYNTRLESSPENYRARLIESGALSQTRDVSTRKLVAWVQSVLEQELPWVLVAQNDRRLEWLPLMFRPGITIDIAAIKHVLVAVLLELARQLPAGSLDFSSTGMPSRSVIEADEAAAQNLRALMTARAQEGRKLGVQEALENIGIWAQYRHRRHRYQSLERAVRLLRRSPAAVRRMRRRHAAQ
jgi:hypothetical protein